MERKNLKLNEFQRKILPGILLGDGHLSTQNNGKTYRLHIYQSIKHEAYVLHLYEIFKEWCLSKPKIIQRTYKTGLCKNKTHTMISFKTVSSVSFRFYAHNFIEKPVYNAFCKNKNTTKKVPKLIKRFLTPIGIAYWYMDHGSIKDKNSKACYLNTQGKKKRSFFNSFTENKLLCEVLQTKFCLQCKPVLKKEKYQIYISSKSYTCLKNLIYCFFIPEMYYKFPLYKVTKLPKK